MKPHVILIACLFLAAIGCVSEKSIIMKYYTIEIPPYQIPAIMDTNSVIDAICEIDQVIINPVYETNQIASRNRSNEITYYVYNQWAIRPSEALKDIIQKHLEASGIFRIVSTRYSRAIPDYRFATAINSLELIEQNRSLVAHLNLDFRLIDNSDDHVILRHQADTTNTLKHKDLNLFASGVSNIFYSELKKFTKKILDNRSLFIKDPE